MASRSNSQSSARSGTGSGSNIGDDSEENQYTNPKYPLCVIELCRALLCELLDYLVVNYWIIWLFAKFLSNGLVLFLTMYLCFNNTNVDAIFPGGLVAMNRRTAQG